MFQNNTIRHQGWEALKQNYTGSIFASLLIFLFHGGVIGIVGGVLSYFNLLSQRSFMALSQDYLFSVLLCAVLAILIDLVLFIPLGMGAFRYFVLLQHGRVKLRDTIGYGYSNYAYVLKNILLMRLKIIFMFMLFLIPGIIQCLRYFAVPYILASDDEEYEEAVLTKSENMMRGYKFQTWKMGVWFGLISGLVQMPVTALQTSLKSVRVTGALSAVILGLWEVLWVMPFQNSAQAALFDSISAQSRDVMENRRRKVDLLVVIPLVLFPLVIAGIIFNIEISEKPVDLNRIIEDESTFSEGKWVTLNVKWVLRTFSENEQGYGIIILDDLTSMLVKTRDIKVFSLLSNKVKQLDDKGISGIKEGTSFLGRLYTITDTAEKEMYENELKEQSLPQRIIEKYVRYWVINIK